MHPKYYQTLITNLFLCEFANVAGYRDCNDFTRLSFSPTKGLLYGTPLLVASIGAYTGAVCGSVVGYDIEVTAVVCLSIFLTDLFWRSICGLLCTIEPLEGVCLR